jgi:hypothetical protein
MQTNGTFFKIKVSSLPYHLAIHFPRIPLVLFVLRQSHWVVQAVLELAILLPQGFEC